VELYFLNFKKLLVVLSSKEMRECILDELSNQEVDANIRFVDSYHMAAKLVQQEKFDPYDHIILNTNVNNKKFKDFYEFIEPSIKKDKKFLIQFKDNQLSL